MAKWKDLINKWNMESLKLKTNFLEMDFTFKDADKDAAWELYIELVTRITTQSLDDNDGDEETALNSIYNIFSLTREIIKKYKRDCIQFSKIAVIVLNQIIRPFTSKWHKISIQGFNEENSKEFRIELKELQVKLLNYTKMLGDLAGVEPFDDLTEL